MAITTVIDKDWEFAQLVDSKPQEWQAASQVPTSVHVELIKAGKIPDPFKGKNEWEVQWVGESDWVFKTSFQIDEARLAHPNTDLVFEGLDTYATVELNGSKILEANNMFVPYRVPVKNHLRQGSNELVITFPSTFIKGRQIEEQNGGKRELWNGDSSRLHVRKAQYNYGWDWGPILMTAGPWKPVYLQTYEGRITDFRVKSEVTENLDVTLTVSVVSSTSSGKAKISLKDPNGKLVKDTEVDLTSGSGNTEFKGSKSDFELWYPVGYGKQPIYTVEVTLLNESGKSLDTQTQKIGIRRARVVEEELSPDPETNESKGKTFLFEINNVRIFSGGSNWIPADSFLTEITPERYRAWLQILVDGNQNMIRVWGGGIYEADVFYDICDELGILVWQDFMFGCGIYPAYDEFLQRVETEVEANVKRLRHHPSIVIFAGNNEDYQIAESLNYVNYNDENSDFRNTKFPARYIYEKVLPKKVAALCDIHYHRGSPYSGEKKDTRDRTLGDIHQWNVWHGTQEPWHNWDILSGRFVSEFGMEGFPDIRTVDYWLDGDKSERYPQSRTTDTHNKADGWTRRLETYLVENFKHTFEMEDYVYYSQVMQAETLASAYRLWRREWRGRGNELCAGALVWQLNDCWPVTSWAIVDYFLRPKPSYYTIARELRPYTVGVTRKDVKTFANKYTAAHFTIDTIIEIWGTNSTLEDKKATLEVTAFNLEDPSWTKKSTQEVTLKANQSTELLKDKLPGQNTRSKQSEVPKPIILSVRLLEGDKVLARYANWPEPFKFLTFPSAKDVNLKIDIDGEKVTLSADRPIKGLVLDVDGDAVKWSDQAIDLVPGDAQVVTAKGLDGKKIKARWVGDGV